MPRGIPNPKPQIETPMSDEPEVIPTVENIAREVRPTSSTKGVNAQTNYNPSIDRNAIDQASQPTGTGSVAGGFDEGDLQETTVAWRPEPINAKLANLVDPEHDSPPPIQPPEELEKLFPIRLLRNYRPLTDRWYPLLSNGRLGKRPVADGDDGSPKVKAGFFITLPISEAKQIIKRGIAERADEIG